MKTNDTNWYLGLNFGCNRHSKTIPASKDCLGSVHLLDTQGEDDLAVPAWAGECDAAVNLSLTSTADPDFDAGDGRT